MAAALVATPVAASERLPVASIDFEAEYTVRETPEARSSPMYIRHSGGWYRYDIEDMQPQIRGHGFAREGYAGGIFVMEVGAARLAVRIASLAGDPVYDLWGKRGTRIGESEFAGEHCSRWRVEPDATEVTTSKRLITCVTNDGVPLNLAWEDRPKLPLLRIVSVQRRPQNPAWFSLPPGVKLRDVPDMAGYEREVMAWAKSLAAPRRKK